MAEDAPAAPSTEVPPGDGKMKVLVGHGYDCRCELCLTNAIAKVLHAKDCRCDACVQKFVPPHFVSCTCQEIGDLDEFKPGAPGEIEGTAPVAPGEEAPQSPAVDVIESTATGDAP